MTVLDSGRDAGGGVFSFNPGPAVRSAGPLTRLRRAMSPPRAAMAGAGHFDPTLHVQVAGPLTRLRRSGSGLAIELPQLPRISLPDDFASRAVPVAAALIGTVAVTSLLAKPRPDATSEAHSATGGGAAGPAAARVLPAKPELLPGRVEARLIGGEAVLPDRAPRALRQMVAAGNEIEGLPYVWGGGHGSFNASGYDCSGAVSYVLHGAGLLDSPLASGALEGWGEPGPGKAVTVYASGGHVFAVIAGLRWDTSGTGGSGPAWHSDLRSTAGYVARHPAGL